MMLKTLSYEEYISWIAYYSVVPFPEERADLRNAMLITAVGAMLGGKPKIKDFIVDYWGEQRSEKQSPTEVLGKLKLIIGYGGGKH